MTEPTFRSLIVNRHARVGIIGDTENATEAWLILHGYGMLAQGILHWFRAAARPGRVLVAPEALSRFYVEFQGTRRVGASWMTREAREDDLADLLPYLAEVATPLRASCQRLEVHGFSQGVAAAARLLVHAPLDVERLVCWGGTVPLDAEPAKLSARVRGGVIDYVVGQRDTRTPRDAVVADAERMRASGAEVRVHEFDGGHRIDDGVLAALDELD
ncbi:MAG: esterase [Gemmatimonadales bacterium]|nr:esterase [Gemmatimonadales bacterium]